MVYTCFVVLSIVSGFYNRWNLLNKEKKAVRLRLILLKNALCYIYITGIIVHFAFFWKKSKNYNATLCKISIAHFYKGLLRPLPVCLGFFFQKVFILFKNKAQKPTSQTT